MLKFLRKYSKWLLIIFGVLLMVAFTAPQAIQQLGNAAANRTVAELGGREIRIQELQDADRQQALLRQRLPSQVMPALNPENEGLHWLMLREEAARAGLVGIAGDGAIWVEDFAPQIARQQIEVQLAQQIGPQLAAQFAGQQWAMMDPNERQQMIDRIAGFLRTPPSNISQREYHEALSIARGINRLTANYFESAPLSDTRAKLDAARLQRFALVEAYWLSGRDAMEIAGEPTEEQLREHYERFASTPLGGGDFGIGYTLPERLKIEYLKIDRQAIEANITPDPLEVRKRYQTDVRLREADGEQPRAFDEVREDIERQLRSEIADEVIKSAQQAFVGAMGEATRALTPEGPYKRLPENFAAERPSFEAVAQQMVETVSLTRFPEARGGSVTLPTPEVIRPDEWLWPGALMALPDFGRAQISIGSARAPVAQVLFAVRELRPEMGSRLAIQKDLPVLDVPATDGTGNVYFYTVLDVRPESRPDDMGEIREQLVEDWKALTAFETLQGRADEAAANAAQNGLTASAVELMTSIGAEGEAPTPQTIRVSPSAVTSTAGFQPQAIPQLNTERFRNAVMDVFDSLDPLVLIDETPMPDRTLAIPVPGTLTLAVGTVNRITPLTVEAYRQQADQLDMMLRLDELRAALPAGNPFSFEAMSRRVNLRVIGRDGQEQATEAQTEPSEPTEG